MTARTATAVASTICGGEVGAQQRAARVEGSGRMGLTEGTAEAGRRQARELGGRR